MSSKERLLIQVLGDTAAPAELPRSGMLAIGSSPTRAGFVLTNQGVAEVHCAIGLTKSGDYAVKDLGSEYGTLVNGTRITQARLQKGDEITIGSVRLTVVAADGGAHSEPAPAPVAATKKAAPKRKSPRAPMPDIPGYRLQQLLGKGAMGEVYLALQISLDREVALKVLSKKHEADQAFVASFQAEARAAAALNHPNVVTVHDVGQQDGVHYLTMEYMDRSSLEERIVREGALPWTLVLQALKDAASGLVYAESRGIVHRDIKPANLMQNQAGATKIADLGLATSISQEENPDGENKIFGTPHFISPEQIKGKKADNRSDLYSLGSTAYRLLTGFTPFEGSNTREILRAKLKGQPVPIIERANDVPEGLVQAVERLMQLEPEDRFPSASALLRELERLDPSGNGDQSAASEEESNSSWLKIALPAFAVGLLAVGYVALNKEEPLPVTPPDHSSASGESDPTTEISNAELPELGDVTGGDEVSPPEDNDFKEQLFERDAENALLRLGQQDISMAERRDALRELALKFIGTTTATEASEEARDIGQKLRAMAAANVERDSKVNSVFAHLQKLATLDDPKLSPGPVLSALMEAEGLADLASDKEFQVQYNKLQADLIAKSIGLFEVELIRIGELQADGQFEEVKAALTILFARTALPALEDPLKPARYDEIVSLGLALQARLDNLDNFKLDFQQRIESGDRLALAEELGTGSGLLSEISQLNFDAANARTARLTEQLRSPAAKSRHTAYENMLSAASRALPLLYGKDNWRRKTVPDPTHRRLGAHEVVKSSEAGLVIAADGQTKDIPWASFGQQTKALHKLFSKRLQRDYSAEESKDIASLMLLAAVTESYAEMARMFEPGNTTAFTATNAEHLAEPFENVVEWILDPSILKRFQEERTAVELLGQAMLHAHEEAWSSAVAELEQLQTEYASTWLVLLLSDGTLVNLPE